MPAPNLGKTQRGAGCGVEKTSARNHSKYSHQGGTCFLSDITLPDIYLAGDG